MLVPEILIDISQSVEGSIIGLPHTLICTAIVVIGVSPSLVEVEWSGSTSLSESPRVTIFHQSSTGSQHRLKFGRTVTFSPLLGHDIGEYTCSVTVTAFDRIGDSESVMVMANGTYVKCARFTCTVPYISYCLKLWPEHLFLCCNFSSRPLSKTGACMRPMFIS